MNEISYLDLENVQAEDIGKIALYHPNGGTIAVEDTLEACISAANQMLGDDCVIDDNAAGGRREMREDDICTDDWDLSELCAARIR